MQGKPKVSIIIVYYRKFKVLKNCLDSIYKNKSKVPFEIIVVDNDEKRKITTTFKRNYPQAIYLKSSVNVGYSAGVNLGNKKACGEYLFILNSDTVLFKNTIDELVSFADNKKKLAIVAPVLLDENLTPYKLQGTRELNPVNALFSLSFLNKIFPDNPVSRKFWLKDVDINKR